MLEPRESDIPALFVVLVVLPLVAYFLLGKWSEAAKKRDRITLLAHLAAEEASRVEEMAISDVVPPVSSTKVGLHVCAMCSAPAQTRCSRCKTVRYCSGNCQIFHWRNVHKHECQILEAHKLNSSPLAVSVDEFSHMSGLCYDNMNSQFCAQNLVSTLNENLPSDNLVPPPIDISPPAMENCAPFNNSHVPAFERKISHKSTRETRRRNSEITVDSSTNSSSCKATSSPSSAMASKEVFLRRKLKNNDYAIKEEENAKKVNANEVHINGQNASRSAMLEDDNYQNQLGNALSPRNNLGHSSSPNTAVIGELLDKFQSGDATNGGKAATGVNCPFDEAEQAKCSSEMTSKGSIKARKSSRPPETKCLKSQSKASVDLFCPEMEMEGQSADETRVSGIRNTIPSQGSNGATSIGIRKMMGLRKSAKHTVMTTSLGSGDRSKMIRMLFPYDDFVQFFQSEEVFGIYPRGLVNCGNSCYANAVLQCLTCTKPLVVYFLCGSHSKACCTKDWCLMCELEQQIMILRENGGPLSPSRILWHMRSINSQMGDGSQEDAHEFLRLLIASMQSICLEGLGGEKRVDPRLQETTYIQHTFGGRLQSKVKCLNCNHESERYENIMDLTLEILGWVESLEDALTQFTSPEDLDGENMYKCGRCTTYVRARKKLSIHEAPNILTIVLKRFQEGRYGKINKCISFPEMLDMIPFMTGKGDIPPLYMLYAVVVHLDTLNASFSGHYVSYVKDLQGNWFRIDDTEVQPVLISQVMLEGAYILFYMRSSPRPQSSFSGKVMQQQIPCSSKPCSVESHKPSKSGHRRDGRQFAIPEPSHNARPESTAHYADTSNGTLQRSTNRNFLPVTETFTENNGREFSDANSSDWSLFTSSDEASFTTESTRDSFSTVDYGDACNMDQFSSIFNYATENSRNSVCHRKFLHSRPLTRFVPENGQPFDNNLPSQNLEWARQMNQSKRAGHSSIEPLSNGSDCSRYVYYGNTNPIVRTHSHYEP